MTTPDLDGLADAFCAAHALCTLAIQTGGDPDGWLQDLKSCAQDGIDLIGMMRRMDTPDGWSP